MVVVVFLFFFICDTGNGERRQRRRVYRRLLHFVLSFTFTWNVKYILFRVHELSVRCIDSIKTRISAGSGFGLSRSTVNQNCTYSLTQTETVKVGRAAQGQNT